MATLSEILESAEFNNFSPDAQNRIRTKIYEKIKASQSFINAPKEKQDAIKLKLKITEPSTSIVSRPILGNVREAIRVTGIEPAVRQIPRLFQKAKPLVAISEKARELAAKLPEKISTRALPLGPLGMLPPELRLPIPLRAIGKEVAETLPERPITALLFAIPSISGAAKYLSRLKQVPPVLQKARQLAMAGEESGLAVELELLKKKAARFIPVVKKKPEVKIPIKLKPIQELQEVGKETITSNVLSLENTNKIVNATALTLPKIPQPELEAVINQSKKIMDIVSNGLKAKQINVSADMQDMLSKFGQTTDDLAAQFKTAASFSGKTLNQLSQLKTKINEFLSKAAPEISSILKDEKLLQTDPLSRLGNLFRGIEETRRGLLVSQPATAVRNAISQAGRYSLNIATKAMAGTIESITGKVSPSASFADATENFLSIGRRLSSSSKLQLENILKLYPNEAEVLLGTPFQGITFGNKAVKLFNTFNTMQEGFFRRMAFEGRLGANLKRIGFGLKDVPKMPTQIVKPLIDDAVREALKLTFSGTPENPIALRGLKIFRSFGPLGTATINPFPRFWANAFEFTINHSPFGFTRFLSPAIRNNLFSTDKRMAVNAFSEALTGSLAWSAGWAIRNSKFAGEKWYEIRPDPSKPEKVIDLRSFTPLTFPLFMAEVGADYLRASKHEPIRITRKEAFEAAVSISRMAGVRAVMADLFIGRRAIFGESEAEVTLKQIQTIAGEYLASFGVPLRVLSDVIADLFDPNEAISRDRRDNPFKGPIKETIPILRQELPPYQPITRTTPLVKEKPLLRQMTGIVQKTKTFAERELQRLGIPEFEVSPRTGMPEVDRRISQLMAPDIERLFDVVQRLPEKQGLKALPIKEQAIRIRDEITKIRERAFDIFRSENPALDLERKIRMGSIRPRALGELLLNELKEIKSSKEPEEIE